MGAFARDDIVLALMTFAVLFCANGRGAQPSFIDSPLAGMDAARRDLGVGVIRQMLVGPTRFEAIEGLKRQWLRQLIDKKRYVEVAELA
jgi:hypothetical protein